MHQLLKWVQEHFSKGPLAICPNVDELAELDVIARAVHANCCHSSPPSWTAWNKPPGATLLWPVQILNFQRLFVRQPHPARLLTSQ